MLGEHTSAASAYVAMTRGRDNNVAHLVADDTEDARRQWEEVFGRDRADLGPAAAAEQAAEDIERYGTQKPTRPLDEVLTDLWAAWTRQADLHEQHRRLVGERDALQQVAAIQARYTPDRRAAPRRRGRRQASLVGGTPAGRRPRRRADVRDQPTSRRASGARGARSSHRRSAPPRSSVRARGDWASTGDRSATPAPS